MDRIIIQKIEDEEREGRGLRGERYAVRDGSKGGWWKEE
jgi:hypothetical protein